jgi:hypothetical protein
MVISLGTPLEDIEREVIRRSLVEVTHHRRQATKLLGISVRSPTYIESWKMGLRSRNYLVSLGWISCRIFFPLALLKKNRLFRQGIEPVRHAFPLRIRVEFFAHRVSEFRQSRVRMRMRLK